VRTIPTLHHLEIIALQQRFANGLRALQGQVQGRVPHLDARQVEALTAIVERNAVLREGAKSLRAGREWLLGVMLGLLMGLHEEEPVSNESERASNQRQLESRKTRVAFPSGDSKLANSALRFSKSCVLWARFLS
jgi:hypothetical protein